MKKVVAELVSIAKSLNADDYPDWDGDAVARLLKDVQGLIGGVKMSRQPEARKALKQLQIAYRAIQNADELIMEID